VRENQARLVGSENSRGRRGKEGRGRGEGGEGKRGRGEEGKGRGGGGRDRLHAAQ
jgi:hypothetical protein